MNLNIKEPVAILGYGIEGKSVYKFLKANNVKNITILDQNNLLLDDSFKYISGKNAFDDLNKFKTIFRSPGVRYDMPSLQEAIELGSVVSSATKLTLKIASDRITAITGTNGKTTTIALLANILNAHYANKIIIGGNDKNPVLNLFLEHKNYPILLEASSFQFEDLKESPYISAILNITNNHLDWHQVLENYIKAKSNVLKYQKESDWAVLNADDENVRKLSHATKAQIFWINKKIGSEWAVWEDGYLKLSFNGSIYNILHNDQLSVKTKAENILFAAAIAFLHYTPVSTIEEQIKLFKGVEHRLEYVKTLKDIHFYNDSSSTSPESAMTAIDQFIPHKLILLLGGSSKKSEFDFLADKIVKNKVRVYLYGKEKQKIKELILSLGGKNLILSGNDNENDFRHIIKNTYKMAKAEDSIVLSPACASFDMFKNSKDRGLQFKEIVNKIK